ncbi:MAG: YggS family pyridoxal phosphate-dependent enzyme [Rubellimicrobium sp.]|nr:YggS family pyridoxal phosphate-dependent enzyme [Rubellimicrobium sp.]
MATLQAIRDRIDAAARGAGRDPGAVTLIAVSKTQPDDRVAAVLAQGQRVFGENRVQEAQSRWEARRDGLELHLIGPLQTNKARAAVALFDVIHTVDRARLVAVLARLAQERGHSPALFVQVNTGDESQKAGCAVAEVDALVAQVRGEGLPLLGLMCIPPVDADPAPHFRALRAMAERNGLAGLSMGMSADFETAVTEGATHVRVGSALFGARG